MGPVDGDRLHGRRGITDSIPGNTTDQPLGADTGKRTLLARVIQAPWGSPVPAFPPCTETFIRLVQLNDHCLRVQCLGILYTHIYRNITTGNGFLHVLIQSTKTALRIRNWQKTQIFQIQMAPWAPGYIRERADPPSVPTLLPCLLGRSRPTANSGAIREAYKVKGIIPRRTTGEEKDRPGWEEGRCNNVHVVPSQVIKHMMKRLIVRHFAFFFFNLIY